LPEQSKEGDAGPEGGGTSMELITAIVMGIVGGLVVKALFLKQSHMLWDAVFGLVGGFGAYFLYSSVSTDVTKAVFALGTAVLVAGVLHEIRNRFVRPA
jgi:uncharacterized membrane protein YeaQ/YmgE (transglycosylase-associated protein family)